MRERVTLAICAVLLAAGAGCNVGPGTTLADMVNKELVIDGPESITLGADGCALLIPGTVEATINGHPMSVDPGRPASVPYDEPCHYPSFGIDLKTIDVGPSATVQIKDQTETLTVVMTGFHPQAPMLPTPDKEAMKLDRSIPVRIPFTTSSGLPDEASFSFITGWDRDGCIQDESSPASIEEGAISTNIPSSLCLGSGELYACVGYTNSLVVQSCENAVCQVFYPERKDCVSYPIVFDP
jgi:hypothetical protein